MPNSAGKSSPDDKPAPQPAPPSPDTLETHCPRLGGQVPLRYCLKPAQETPCPRIMDCWWQTIDIESLLRSHLDPEQFESFLKSPKSTDRLDFILNILDRLKKKT